VGEIFAAPAPREDKISGGSAALVAHLTGGNSILLYPLFRVRRFLTFYQFGNLLSLRSEPETGQIDEVLRQFRDRRRSNRAPAFSSRSLSENRADSAWSSDISAEAILIPTGESGSIMVMSTETSQSYRYIVRSPDVRGAMRASRALGLACMT